VPGTRTGKRWTCMHPPPGYCPFFLSVLCGSLASHSRLYVHGNGNNWDPMGFPWKWEWQWLCIGNDGGSGNNSTGM